MSDKTEKWQADDCRVFMGDGGISLHAVPNGVERARLIAAAPDLLAVLIEAEARLRPLSGRSRNADLHASIVAAISRATGETGK